MNIKTIAVHHSEISADDIMHHDDCVAKNPPGLNLRCFACDESRKIQCMRIIYTRKRHARALEQEAAAGPSPTEDFPEASTEDPTE